MKPNLRAIAAACAAIALLACSRQPEPPAKAAAAVAKADGVHWVSVHRAADVEAAFGDARAAGRPVFLYWGAVWCPPCNQVKSTIFTRADFIAQSRAFVPVYLDGDAPSAQKLGRQFRVSAYPTMILLRPDGTEVTRLAGAVEPEKYLQLLRYGLSGTQTAKQALAAALQGARLSGEDWRLLAYYAWETDEQQLAPEGETAAIIDRLARACPQEHAEARARLELQSIVAAAVEVAKRGQSKGVPSAEAAKRAKALIARPEAVRAHHDLVAGQADDIVGYASPPQSEARRQLTDAWLAALAALQADATLPRAAQLWTVTAKVLLHKLDEPKASLPPALLEEVRAQVQRLDRDVTDANERQSVINSAAYALAQAGLLQDSDALLLAELKRSHSPYYQMLGLAANAKKRGDAAAAIDWARRAFESSRGPATRVQWGASYVGYLIEFAASDAPRIERAALQVVEELVASPDAFFARNRSVLERMHGRLAKWSESGSHAATLARLRERLDGLCAQLPSGDTDREACDRLFARKA